MADRSAEPWYATAAYLYVLHLDSPALAWEYLRRHPDYRHDWLRRRRQPDTAGHWGLRLLEDPALDARDAHPAWFPDHDAVVQLYPDADPPPDALCFDFWRLPGHKHLIHDGKRLVLVAHWPGCCLRFVLAPGLADGMAYAYAIRACAAPCERYAALASELNKIAVAAGAVPAATVRPRPPLSALLELHTLQALDATLAGASLREVAEGLFGLDAVTADWHADSALRARVRRLVRRGDGLMRGGYRRLAQLPVVTSHEGGRFAITAGQAVDGVVLSGVRGVVLSGVRLSCYQEYENAGKPVTARVCVPSNITNLNSLTIDRETALRWTTAAGRKTSQAKPQKPPRSAQHKQAGLPSWRVAP